MFKHRTTNIVSLILITFMIGIHYYNGLHWGWYLGLGCLYLAVLAYGSSQINSNYHLFAHCDGPKDKKEIALTFDDGPVAEFTPEILNTLSEFGAKATFFCIGSRLEKERSLAKTIHNQGHLIGNHSYSHSDFFDFYSTKRVKKELIKTNSLIKGITGRTPRLFRPPLGVTNPNLRRASQALEMEVIGWNVRSLDTAIQDERKIVARIMDRLKPGAIILVHDSHPRILNVLKEILPKINQKGYKIVPLDQLLNIKAYD